jgi:hypothetical protein
MTLTGRANTIATPKTRPLNEASFGLLRRG